MQNTEKEELDLNAGYPFHAVIPDREEFRLDNVLDADTFKMLQDFFLNLPKEEMSWDQSFGRWDYDGQWLHDFCDKYILPIAREKFNSPTLKQTYSLFAHYEGPQSNLPFHRDNNACTYTIDLCVYQNRPWTLWIENRPYELGENDAVGFYGNDQLHGRHEMPDPDNQFVANVFFHFAEPDHWWFTKGPRYLDVIRGYITEEVWNKFDGKIPMPGEEVDTKMLEIKEVVEEKMDMENIVNEEGDVFNRNTTPIGHNDLALVLDGKVIDIITTEQRTAAILLSNPEVVDVTGQIDMYGGPIHVGISYDKEKGGFYKEVPIVLN